MQRELNPVILHSRPLLVGLEDGQRDLRDEELGRRLLQLALVADVVEELMALAKKQDEAVKTGRNRHVKKLEYQDRPEWAR